MPEFYTIPEIAGILRHASIQTTFDVYGHLFPEHGQEAAKRLDAALFGAAR